MGMEQTTEFDRTFTILAAQRHAKVIGIFSRLFRRDGKPTYLQHLPRVWNMLEKALLHPALVSIANWFERHTPTTVRNNPRPKVNDKMAISE
jgi:aminoglycoside/choline kinase family phosphotransferase